MNKKIVLAFFLILVCSYSFHAQTKKWTLEECVRYAVQNNISVKQSELDEKAIAIDKKDAKGNFLPTFNANASHSWNIGLNQDITTGLLRNQTTQFTSAGASVGIDIYKGLQNQNTLRKARLSIVAAQYQVLKMKEDISLNVANAFLQVLFNQENLKVQKEQLAINEKQLGRSEELVKAGSIPRGDLLDVKATVATNNQNVVTAENALLISKLSLAQLLQLKDFYDFDVANDTSVNDKNNILSQKPTAIYDKAIENRTESKIAVKQQELDLERNVYTAFTDAKGALKTYESAVTALEAREEAFRYATERYTVGMMNSFDFNQAQTLLSNAQSEVIRTKYDYIFKIKILEFYFGIPIIKN